MSKNAGCLVETKKGKIGRTYHRDNLINGKRIVYLFNEKIDYEINDGVVNFINEIDNISQIKMLCEPNSLKIIGYID